MKKEEAIFNFLIPAKQQIKKLRFKSGDYCIVVFVDGNRSFVYKSLPDFESKFPKKADKLNDEHQLDFELWSFD